MSRTNDVAIRQATEDDLDGLLDLYAHLNPNDAPLPQQARVVALWQEIVASPTRGSRALTKSWMASASRCWWLSSSTSNTNWRWRVMRSPLDWIAFRKTVSLLMAAPVENNSQYQ